MLRLSSLFIISSLLLAKLFAIEVVVATQDIHYNEFVTDKMVRKTEVKSVKRNCTPASFEAFKTKKLQATHYMKKGFIICQNDIKEYSNESVLFNFGSIQIEKHGEIIFENDEYLRIRKSDGEIEKIYKDGRIK
ncbi:hypothetical protein [Halarcobacter bivalviorum]|uniref:hypothetical protein n=1 Tax=Halarcobacter bivalviorum TaxID=663364 RepID=UPI00100B26DC|nr:hypothetical protein [Halarcobacter bivalviorum]RXK05298.1 hypothetical protein CRU97_08105 [Halarcobacter bivalviorum]